MDYGLDVYQGLPRVWDPWCWAARAGARRKCPLSFCGTRGRETGGGHGGAGTDRVYGGPGCEVVSRGTRGGSAGRPEGTEGDPGTGVKGPGPGERRGPEPGIWKDSTAGTSHHLSSGSGSPVQGMEVGAGPRPPPLLAPPLPSPPGPPLWPRPWLRPRPLFSPFSSPGSPAVRPLSRPCRRCPRRPAPPPAAPPGHWGSATNRGLPLYSRDPPTLLETTPSLHPAGPALRRPLPVGPAP